MGQIEERALQAEGGARVRIWGMSKSPQRRGRGDGRKGWGCHCPRCGKELSDTVAHASLQTAWI
uniref:Uncharacterized protein n=1 Tax=Mustela putorius furo TaxID=9669 RepID=M3Y516_MUSPF